MAIELLAHSVEIGLVTTNLPPMVEPLTEFTALPGIGWLFVADPDGNWVELAGPL